MTATVPTSLSSALAGRYEVLRELGHGGMATVYLARDVRHDRPVAVKVLRPELASSVGGDRFLREIGITARLQHPHVLTLIDSGEIDADGGGGLLFYVMPYVEGETLRARLERDGAIAIPEAVRLLREIADAVAYAHRNGIVHRDIKPDNVMLSQQHALVVDFGIAKALSAATTHATLTAAGMSVGTPAYMAPEQALGSGEIDHRSDIYALGVLAYEMLSGRAPFDGPPLAVISAHVNATPVALSTLRPEVPHELAVIVARCLEKTPEQRYPTADELLSALDALAVAPRPASSRKQLAVWGGAVAALAAVAVAIGMFVVAAQRERWVRAEAIPLIRQLIDTDQADSAFVVATRASALLPNDSTLNQLWQHAGYRHAFRSDPEGARVYRARFADTTSWELVGTTPTDTVRVPRAMTRYRFVKPGYLNADVYAGGLIIDGDAISGAALPDSVILLPADSPDSGMISVKGPVIAEAGSQLKLRHFLIDRHEVTNRQFRQFVDAGGYERRELWTEPFVLDGRTVPWEVAIARFVDRTGRPAPAMWEAGAPPSGSEDLPVGGISWYEAAAYARFAGKSLPTRTHWNQAAVLTAATFVAPGSNFESELPRAPSRSAAMSATGAFDMAGNVREWTLTEDGEGRRYILGGGWTDPVYRFTDPMARDPFDRSPINGMRLARYEDDSTSLAAAMRPYVRPFRDYTRERPASDAEFASYRLMYEYDPTPLDARVEFRDTSAADWVRERISFAAAYPGERVSLLLFTPKRHRGPHQTLVLFPGSNALYDREIGEVDMEILGFLMRNGRALAVPSYKGTYDRQDPSLALRTSSTVAYRDAMITWGKDLRRSVDYLQSRPDLDAERIGYLGISLGGRLGGLMMGIEDRFRLGILYVAGLGMIQVRPEVDPINFLPRVRFPVLMLNGRYDDGFALETSQRPLYEFLGTPAAHKRWVLFDDGHFLPRAQMMSETLGWLDRYFGRPRR
jgi:eukaryotic-like serine/threonine-protein kinase